MFNPVVRNVFGLIDHHLLGVVYYSFSIKTLLLLLLLFSYLFGLHIHLLLAPPYSFLSPFTSLFTLLLDLIIWCINFNLPTLVYMPLDCIVLQFLIHFLLHLSLILLLLHLHSPWAPSEYDLALALYLHIIIRIGSLLLAFLLRHFVILGSWNILLFHLRTHLGLLLLQCCLLLLLLFLLIDHLLFLLLPSPSSLLCHYLFLFIYDFFILAFLVSKLFFLFTLSDSICLILYHAF